MENLVALQSGKFVTVAHVREGRLVPDLTAFENLLNRYSKRDEKIAIVSIYGQARTGKSYIFNLILYYANTMSIHKGAKTDWMKDDECMSQFGCFMVGAGTKPVTNGIYIWDSPITVTINRYEKMHVFLMDTPGVDVASAGQTKQEQASSFTFGSLLSALQIYNINRQVGENHLEQLEVLAKLSNELNSEQDDPVSQQILFLIRDWEGTYPCGPSSEYLKEFCPEEQSSSTLTDQQWDTRKNLRQLLCMECYLLPHPGPDFVDDCLESNPADIKFGALRKKFRKYAEEWVAGLFSDANRYKMLQCAHYATDLINLFQALSEQLERGSFDVPSLKESLVLQQFIKLEDELQKLFMEKFLENPDDATAIKSSILKLFDDKKLMYDSSEGRSQYRERIDEYMRNAVEEKERKDQELAAKLAEAKNDMDKRLALVEKQRQELMERLERAKRRRRKDKCILS